MLGLRAVPLLCSKTQRKNIFVKSEGFKALLYLGGKNHGLWKSRETGSKSQLFSSYLWDIKQIAQSMKVLFATFTEQNEGHIN